MYKTHKAFTMLELIMVIAIIGILSAVALPKFAASRTDAELVKAKSIVSAVRLGIATARQSLILSGNFTPVTFLTNNTGTNVAIFDAIEGDITTPVLEYPIRSCETATSSGCWITTNLTTYTYRMPLPGTVNFILTNSKFVCQTPANANCQLLTQ
ncbi:MAG: type II secretion system protein [Sulfurovum sp.]